MDKYRPPDYDAPAGPFSRWAFRMRPQFTQVGDTWTASRPGTDWTVTAASRDEARRRLDDEAERRLRAGDEGTLATFSEAVYRRHLIEPIAGMYAMDIGVCNQLQELGADMDRAFAEAERRRVQGRPYTVSDYRAGAGGDSEA